MAPPDAPDAALTSWAAPPPNARLFASVAPRISMMAHASGGEGDGDRVPPPPSLPNMDGQGAMDPDPNLVPYEVVAQLEGRIDELTRGLEAARASVEVARKEALQTSEREIVKLALAVAERVIGHAFHADPSMVASWVKEGIAALSHEDSVRCVVSPRIGEILQATNCFAGLEEQPDLVVDPRFDDVHCEIRGKYGRVDAGLAARLDAVASALGVERVQGVEREDAK
jgi:hypothetical protein